MTDVLNTVFTPTMTTRLYNIPTLRALAIGCINAKLFARLADNCIVWNEAPSMSQGDRTFDKLVENTVRSCRVPDKVGLLLHSVISHGRVVRYLQCGLSEEVNAAQSLAPVFQFEVLFLI